MKTRAEIEAELAAVTLKEEEAEFSPEPGEWNELNGRESALKWVLGLDPELEARVLADIVGHPDDTAVGIAVRLEVAPPSVTRALLSLLKSGAITRERPKGWPNTYRAVKK